MSEHIPFITSESACGLVAAHYSDSDVVRVTLDRLAKFHSLLPSRPKLWIDAAVDGLDDISVRKGTTGRNNAWYDYIQTFPNYAKIASDSFQQKPVAPVVQEFVKAILNQCVAAKPGWVTVPQLPLVNGSDRNKINRALAKACGTWKSNSRYSGRLILPLVSTHQDQLNKKTQRNAKVTQAEKCFHESQADGFWVVDKSLTDDNGSKTLRNTRLPGIVSFHEELNARIASKIRIAGPYWGTNLVLWARGLVDYPAIGVGSGYQYFLPGGPSKQPSVRIALPPLRRRTGIIQLKGWLDDVLSSIGTSHPSHAEFQSLRSSLPLLRSSDTARNQVAVFYKRWFDAIAAAPTAGRSMALFQDLSAAYALGRNLPELKEKGTARRPEAVAEPLMLNCL